MVVALVRPGAWLRAVCLGTTALVCIAGVSRAQETFSSATTADKTSKIERRQVAYEIPAADLGDALQQWSRASRLKLLVPTGLINGRKSGGLSATTTPEDALKQLLWGTGLGYRVSGSQSVTLFDQDAAMRARAQSTDLPQITVTAIGQTNPNSTMTPLPSYFGGQVATGGQLGFLGNRSVMDTPFSQTSYTQQLIQNQQAQTVQDVLMNDPSVTLNTPRTAGFADTNIRGFRESFTSLYSFNGLFGIVPVSTVDVGWVERVEILKGPTALLNGMPGAGASIGGTVNLISKRAGDDPLTQLTTSYMSRGQLGGHVDVGRRYGDNKEFGVRFNGFYRDGDNAVKPGSQELGMAMLGLDYRGQRVRIDADIGYQDASTDSPTRILSLNAGVPIPRPPDASKNFFPPWLFWRDKDLFGMVRGEVDLTENVTAYGAIGASSNDGKAFFVNPSLSNVNGDWTATPRNQLTYQDGLSGQAGLRASVDTGPVHHQLHLNVSRVQIESGSFFVDGTAVTSNIYNPRILPVQNPFVPDPRKASERTLSSAGIADTMSILDKRVQLTVGVRRQQVEAINFSTTTGAQTSSYNEYAWTPAYAILVKPWENVSLYANYIEGLEQGTIVGTGFANAGEVFPPYQAKQYEAGVKVDWGTQVTTVSFFEIARPSTITVPGTPLPTLALDGEQVNRGIEINTFGEVVPGVRLLGGVMLIDARLTKTQGGTNDGNKAVGVPDINLVFGGEWDTPFLRGFTMTGRVNYHGEAYFDPQNTRLMPAWTRVDLGARYTFAGPWNNKPVTVRFNVENVFDKNYWVQRTVSNFYLAMPRTYMLSTTFNF